MAGFARRQMAAFKPSTEATVFPLALGCMAMSGMYGPADERESIETIHAALDHASRCSTPATTTVRDTMSC
jgi:aryl-alcohol dehydrogenase-like predicted oxidoreductase